MLERRNRNSLMKKRKLQRAKVKFPKLWMELNYRDAKNSKNVAIIVDGTRVGIYYTDSDAGNLTAEEMAKIDTYASICGFDGNYQVYGLIEQDVIAGTQIMNVENAELVRD